LLIQTKTIAAILCIDNAATLEQHVGLSKFILKFNAQKLLITLINICQPPVINVKASFYA